MTGYDGLSYLIRVQEIGKINSRGRAERVETPGPHIHIQKLELPVARVQFVLDFRQAVVVDGEYGQSIQPARPLGAEGLLLPEHLPRTDNNNPLPRKPFYISLVGGVAHKIGWNSIELWQAPAKGPMPAAMTTRRVKT